MWFPNALIWPGWWKVELHIRRVASVNGESLWADAHPQSIRKDQWLHIECGIYRLYRLSLYRLYIQSMGGTPKSSCHNYATLQRILHFLFGIQGWHNGHTPSLVQSYCLLKLWCVVFVHRADKLSRNHDKSGSFRKNKPYVTTICFCYKRKRLKTVEILQLWTSITYVNKGF